MAERGLSQLIAQTYYVDEYISIQKYYTPLDLSDNQSYEIHPEEHRHFIPVLLEEALKILDQKFDRFDLRDRSNFGIDHNDKLVFTDYGTTKSFYEKEWVPLAEEGILPQILFDVCRICGVKKELRMYGKQDQDKRCFDCGKE